MLEQLLSLLNTNSQTITELAKSIGADEDAVAHGIAILKERGIVFKSDSHNCLSLTIPIPILSKQIIESQISPGTQQKTHLQCHFEVTSTNQLLLDNLPSTTKLCMCSSEWQSEGRGRHKKPWFSPLSHNLLFSFARQWQSNTLLIEAGQLRVLSLMAGVAIATTLKRLGFHQVKLKWPNDIVIQSRNSDLKKMGGILVELKGHQHQGTWVAGIGLNVLDVSNWQQKIDQPITSLTQINQQGYSRESVLAGIIETWIELEQLLLSSGVEAILVNWRKFDVLLNKAITISTNKGEAYQGIARGIDSDGQLQVELVQQLTNDKQIISINSGEVKVRMARATID